MMASVSIRSVFLSSLFSCLLTGGLQVDNCQPLGHIHAAADIPFADSSRVVQNPGGAHDWCVGCRGLVMSQSVPGGGGDAPPLFNVQDYGATGDGTTIDTPAINGTIEAANAAGGGIVEFPPGRYLSVSIHLQSDVTLQLDEGATILAASTGFDPAEPK